MTYAGATSDHRTAGTTSGHRTAKVHRDAWGVPHLSAPDLLALAYVQGLNAAHDRAWQIEVERRRAEGTLAELIGPAGLPWDRFARRARLADTAQRAYAGLDADTRRWVEAYVAGVNDGLAAGAVYAPEFAALGDAPGRWSPWSPLGVFLAQHVLFASFGHKVWRSHVAATLGDHAVELLGFEGPATSGSNAWAVAGHLTVDGSPLIAADPHRLIEAPGVYQQVHLRCPGVDVVGLAFAGVPGVAHFGHTGGVAWAVTNAMADYQDLYVEHLRRDGDRVQARDARGWVDVVVGHESIAVRCGAAETVEVIETARGPVVLGGAADGDAAAVSVALSLGTPSRVLGDLGFSALPRLLQARTCDDVAQALGSWVEPVNSVVVADTSGRVQRLAAGRVPLRDLRNRRLPVPADRQEHAWTGWHPMPRTDVDDLAVVANDRREGDTAELGFDFAPPHRARRIAEVLADGGPADLLDSARLQLDTASTEVQVLVALLDPDGRPGAAPDPHLEGLRRRLHGWNGHMDADSEPAALFAAWRSALVRHLSASHALAPLHAAFTLDAHPVVPGVEVLLPWLDVTARVGHALATLVRHGDRLGLDVAQSARKAARDVLTSPPSGTWGSRHRLRALHVLDGDPAVFEPPVTDVALGGDGECVLATSSVPGVTDLCFRGPVARVVWSLRDRSASRWIVPLGADGRWGSAHCLDQMPQWARGGLVPVTSDPNDLRLELTVPLPDQTLSDQPLSEPAVPVTAFSMPLPGLGVFTLDVLRPHLDASVVHSWVAQERATFWGMSEQSEQEVAQTYAFVDSLPTHHAFVGRLDGRPVGVLQVYEPADDPLGEVYPVLEGDIGIHVLVAPTAEPIAGFTEALLAAIGCFLFDERGHHRLVAEPDARNVRALDRLRRAGFTLGGEVDLLHKRARLAFLRREQFELILQVQRQP